MLQRIKKVKGFSLLKLTRNKFVFLKELSEDLLLESDFFSLHSYSEVLKVFYKSLAFHVSTLIFLF